MSATIAPNLADTTLVSLIIMVMKYKVNKLFDTVPEYIQANSVDILTELRQIQLV
jgi:hypothetical protein